jgi:hypothetical protein
VSRFPERRQAMSSAERQRGGREALTGVEVVDELLLRLEKAIELGGLARGPNDEGDQSREQSHTIVALARRAVLEDIDRLEGVDEAQRLIEQPASQR